MRCPSRDSLILFLTTLVAMTALLLLSTHAFGEITIDQPDGPVGIREMVQLSVDGIPEEDLPGVRVKVFPGDGVFLLTGRQWGGPPFVIFYSSLPGTYVIDIVRAANRNVLETAEATIVVTGVGPDPVPPDPVPPDPTPGPDPQPGPTKDLWAIVFEQSEGPDGKGRKPEVAQVLYDESSQGWRKFMETNGHSFRIVDWDQPAPWAQEWKGAVPTEDALPFLLLVAGPDNGTDEGEVLWSGPLPKTRSDMVAKVKEYGEEK